MLDTGDSFPVIRAKGLDGSDLDVTDLTTGSWGVVLFYRGHW